MLQPLSGNRWKLGSKAENVISFPPDSRNSAKNEKTETFENKTHWALESKVAIKAIQQNGSLLRQQYTAM